jgi:serine phosphatase RsbU (regulator of sigma subunit)
MNGDGSEFSEQRLQDFLRKSHTVSPSEMIQGAVEDVKIFASGAPQADDITALAIRYQQRERHD